MLRMAYRASDFCRIVAVDMGDLEPFQAMPADVAQSIEEIARRFFPLHDDVAHELRIHYMMGHTDATNKCTDALLYYIEHGELPREIT